MLYLVIGQSKEGRILPSKKDFLKLVVEEWETVLGYKEAGMIKEVYGYRDGNGGIIILDLNSEEEVKTLISGLPLYQFADWDIKELMNAEEGWEKARRKLAEITSI